MAPLAERYADRLLGVLSCYDRIVVTGTLPGACYAQGMTAFLYAREIRIFECPAAARGDPGARGGAGGRRRDRDRVRRQGAYPQRRSRSQGARAARYHPGLVHILSATETCQSYKPWHDKKTGRTSLKPDSGKCLHY
jgi:hypothetical protein